MSEGEGAACAAELAARWPDAVDSRAEGQLAAYLDLLASWSGRMNLVGAATAEARRELVADAFPLLPHLPPRAFRLLDAGTGAGLPGLVLAILVPRAEVTLLEPQLKRFTFLQHAIRSLGVSNARALRERLEEHTEQYDVTVSRAVWPLGEWLPRALLATAPGGIALGLEGGEATLLPAGAVRFPYEGPSGPRAVVRLAR